MATAYVGQARAGAPGKGGQNGLAAGQDVRCQGSAGVGTGRLPGP